jgi:hypothetical protein
MAVIDFAGSLKKAMGDPEFSREMRFFTGCMKLAVDDQETVAKFDDGKLVSADVYAGGRMAVVIKEFVDDDCKIVIRGPHDTWDRLLEPFPVPFYQCLQTCNVKHGLFISATNETFAYLPALNRLVALLRAERNG